MAVSVPTETEREQAAAREAGQRGTSTGINMEPGSLDDGWEVPPRVTLDDGSLVQLFKDGEALHAAYDAIVRAKRRICLEVYIFAGDETGQRFAEALAKKARDGIEVNVIYDDFGSMSTDRKMFKTMKQAGVRMQKFHPLRPWECTYSWRGFNRDHRKLLVIDDIEGGLGGLNVGAEYAGSWVVRPSDTKPCSPACDFWRDNAIGVRGPSARVLYTAFARTWNYIIKGGRIARTMTLHPPVADPHQFTVPTEGKSFSLIAAVPTMDSPLRQTLNRLFKSARKSIRMTMAYFAPDDELIQSLCDAARRGVVVQLMLPGKCDVPILITAAHSFYDTLLHAGVQIFERQGVVLHAKTMVIDEKISIVGSTNLDARSIEYNLELSGVITSEEFGQQMKALFENDIRYAVRIQYGVWKRRPYLDRVGQWAVSRARYLL